MGEATARVEWLTVAGDPDVWRSIGLTVTADGYVPLFGTGLRIVPTEVAEVPVGAEAATDARADAEPTGTPTKAPAEAPADADAPTDAPADAEPTGTSTGPKTAAPTGTPTAGGTKGLIGWALSGIEPTDVIAGLATEVVEPTTPTFAQHELGAVELDHVVVMTFSIESSSAGIAQATGCALKRERQVGTTRQGFHRIGRGGLIVELVQHPDWDRYTTDFWGFVINVEDIDAAYELLGEQRLSAPKDAVQPGRRIATFRQDVGLGTAVALMSRDAA